MSSRLRLLGVLTVCLVGALAMSAIGAGTASALEACPGKLEAGKICGQGSSLQKLAQNEVWIPDSLLGFVAEYKGTGSGAGRTVFGEENEGVEPGKEHAPNVSEDTYIGTDEPLSPKQMENGDKAAGAAAGQTLLIPVEEAAVAQIVNEPIKNCVVQISNKKLQEVWSGEITNWNQLAGGCGNHEIVRVVRKDVSGTTFVQKTYLNEIRKGKKTCVGEAGKSWAEYLAVAENTNWPKCGAAKEVEKPAGNGGGEEVAKVASTPDSIGYANLADARAKYEPAKEATEKYTWLKVENQHTEQFEYPGTENVEAGVEPTTKKGNSNCEKTAYTHKPKEAVADDNWSLVNGAHPGTGAASEDNGTYPICTLTYDVALKNYKTAGYPNSKEESQKTKEYLQYVVKENGGQEKIAEHKDYRNVEKAVEEFSEKEAALITVE